LFKTISVKIGYNWMPAYIVQENIKTLWVELPDGNFIKRHKIKHPMKKYVPAPEIEDKPVVVKLSWWQRFLNWMRGGVK